MTDMDYDDWCAWSGIDTMPYQDSVSYGLYGTRLQRLSAYRCIVNHFAQAGGFLCIDGAAQSGEAQRGATTASGVSIQHGTYTVLRSELVIRYVGVFVVATCGADKLIIANGLRENFCRFLERDCEILSLKMEFEGLPGSSWADHRWDLRIGATSEKAMLHLGTVLRLST